MRLWLLVSRAKFISGDSISAPERAACLPDPSAYKMNHGSVTAIAEGIGRNSTAIKIDLIDIVSNLTNRAALDGS